MINRHVRRPSQAVERLQQLCLNSSDGVDVTRAHNDLKSVFGSKNLNVNVDGSVTLRKPILLNNRFSKNILRVIPLDNDAYLAVTEEGFLMLNSSLNSVSFRIMWHDVYDNERVNIVPQNTVIPAASLNVINCTYTSTNTGTVLSNCELSRTVTGFPGTRMDSFGDVYYHICDPKLYDTDASENFSVRLVYVFYNTEQSIWCVRVITPIMNEYVRESGQVYSYRNTFLDNPFAARDSYNVAMPAVKTIRAYVYSSKEAGGVVPVFENTNLTYSYEDSLSGKAARGADYMCVSNQTYPGSNDHVKEFEAYFKGSFSLLKFGNLSVVCQVNVSSGFGISKHPDSSLYGYTSESVSAIEFSLHVHRSTDMGEDVTAMPGFRLTIPAQTLTVSVTHNMYYTQSSGYDVCFGTNLARISVPATEITAESFANGYNVNIVKTTVQPNPKTVFNNGQAYSEYLKSVFDEWDTVKLDVNAYSDATKCTFAYNYTVPSVPTDMRVTDLTESVKRVRYRAVKTIDFNKVNAVVLKAFVALPSEQFDTLYCSWRFTKDGVHWSDALADRSEDGQVVQVSEPSQDPIKDVSAEDTTSSEVSFNYIPLCDTAYAFTNAIASRGDCLVLTKRSDVTDTAVWDAVAFKFKLVSLKGSKIKAVYGEDVFYEAVSTELEFEESDLENAAAGNVLYSGKRLYCYGNPGLKNTILYTYPDEWDAPLTNIIELSTNADKTVSSIVRWRNYLVSATERALYASEQQSDAVFTKTLNASIGIPKSDCNCCVPILNGILFKSGDKVYQLYPNVYSDDGTVLNVTNISQPVSRYLEDASSFDKAPFAFSNESEYVLMLPYTSRTLCLRYNYTTRIWTCHEYEVCFTGVKVNALNDIRLYGVDFDSRICEFKFDTEIDEIAQNTLTKEEIATLPYGDVITRNADGTYGSDISATLLELLDYVRAVQDTHCITPIEFELDTGQKSDTILTTKQFVESKLVFATLNKNDAFPMQLIVHVDGDPHLVTRDISTDAPFWKDGSTSGVLNTTFGGLSSASDNFNTLRQLVVRYSGKGKSVRHILTGKSLCNFKLYETYIRYKLLNVKQ